SSSSACCTTWSSVTFPSRRPCVNANPELVLATALKPSASRTRAEPASHGFGITKGSPAWSARKASPLRCGSCMVHLDDDLPTFAGGHHAFERVMASGKRGKVVIEVDHA